MLITTTNEIKGFDILEYHGLVIESQVAGTGLFSDLTASLSDFFGGRSGTYRSQLEDLFAEIRTSLEKDARRRGANAIIGFSIDFDDISGDGKSMFMVTATGTAVKVGKNRFNYLKQLQELKSFLKDAIITEEEYQEDLNKLNTSCQTPFDDSEITKTNEDSNNADDTSPVCNGYRLGQLVVDLRNENQMKISEFKEDGTFICKKAGTEMVAGEFGVNEIADFKEYWAKKKGRY